jgi:hypothetical protein
MNPDEKSQRGPTAPEPEDFRDLRSGAYDPVNDFGRPQPDQVREKVSPHEKAQGGADVRPDPLPSTEEVLPEGLRRPPQGTLQPKNRQSLTSTSAGAYQAALRDGSSNTKRLVFAQFSQT